MRWSSASADAEAENRATVAYVHWLASSWHGAKSLENRLLHLESEHQHLKAAYGHLQSAYEHLRTSYLDGQAAYERLRALFDTRT